jgi:hypothetical protein
MRPTGHRTKHLSDMGTIYCIDLFESTLNYNRKAKVVHETDTPYAFDVT